MKFSSIVKFAFKGGDENFTRLCNNGWWKQKRGLGFSKTSFETAIHYLMENCSYSNVGNATEKQSIGI